ncbi:MAG: TerB family tellurite resistance protein [Pseudomonadota bacterium]
MFDVVIQYLERMSDGEARGFDQKDRNLAIAALFYHLMAIDDIIHPDEVERYREVLVRRFGISGDRLNDMMDEARSTEAQFSGLFPLTTIINHECDEAQKQSILAQMMDLAGSDGEFHPLELEMIFNTAELLKLPTPQISNAA